MCVCACVYVLMNSVVSLCHRKQKELLKALETPEEKRARRLAKKEQKQRRQREREGWDKDYQVSRQHSLIILISIDDSMLHVLHKPV